MAEEELIKQKLNRLERLRESLQGKTKLWDRVSIYILPVALIAYSMYLVHIEVDENLKRSIFFLAWAVLGLAFEITYRNKVTNKRIDTVIELLELEKLANQKYSAEIRGITEFSDKHETA